MSGQIEKHEAAPPSTEVIKGLYVTLRPVSKDDVPDLWSHLELSESGSAFQWLSFTPPDSQEQLWELLETAIKTRQFIVYAILGDPKYLDRRANGPDHSATHLEALGTIGYLDVNQKHRTIEIGAVLFGRALRRTAAATEAHYLLLRNVCEPASPPPYRRIAWKNNSENTASRRAAERLGYKYEGTWRNHMIVRGRSRNSDWLSITEEEWPNVKLALEQWLDSANFDESGKQIKKLEDFRAIP